MTSILKLINMSKCEHGEKITTFCASDCCVWKEAAGCEQCIRKYHNHMGPTIFLSEEEVTGIVKKYTMDNSIKPKCRLLQETIFSYFNLIKSELTNSMDVICKNIINQIGYPYLYSSNTLSTYKRLKNKEYKKLVQKEFKLLYELSLKINEKDLAREESKIYMTEMKATEGLLNNLETIIKSYENIIKGCHSNFVHDSSFINKINDIIRNMNIDSPTKGSHRSRELDSRKASDPHSISKESPKEKVQYKPEYKLESKLSERLKEARQQNESVNTRNAMLGSPPSLARPNYSRDVSIDKKIVKQPRFAGAAKKEKEKQAEKSLQKSEKQLNTTIIVQQNNQKIETLRQELNHKEIEINEKKKMLIDMMKQKQDSLKNSKEKSINDLNEKRETSLTSRGTSQAPNFLKSKVEETKSMNDCKSSDTSNELQEDESNTKTQDVQNHAFTKLPLEQSCGTTNNYLQQIPSAKSTVIVIETPPVLKTIHSDTSQINSPLLKKKNTMTKYEEYKQKYYLQEKVDKIQEKDEPFLVNNSRIADKDQVLQLNENQAKSLALLLKSLALNAQEAVVHLESALKYAENNLSAAEYLTYLYLQLNRPHDCLHLCNKMLEKIQLARMPEEMAFLINNNKSAALNILGRYSESIVILEKCLRCREKDYFYKNLGDAYFSISIYDKAIYNYEKALKLNESYDEAQYNLAVCLYIQQNYFNAKLAIRKALEEQPLNDDYRQLQYNIETKIGQF